jgi:hypothetical protein
MAKNTPPARRWLSAAFVTVDKTVEDGNCRFGGRQVSRRNDTRKCHFARVRDETVGFVTKKWVANSRFSFEEQRRREGNV